MNPQIMNWDLPKQTEVDDCFRCCVAAVLGAPAESVPNFCAEAERDKKCMDALAQRWLNARGYCLVEAKKLTFPRYHGDGFDGLPVIAGGPTERSRGMGNYHAVVMIAGTMVYDPHPSSAGLTAITAEYVVVPLRGSRAHPAEPKPDKNVVVPKFDLLTEGYDPEKLKR